MCFDERPAKIVGCIREEENTIPLYSAIAPLRWVAFKPPMAQWSISSLELVEETLIVLEEQPEVLHLILEHGGAFKAHAEGET